MEIWISTNRLLIIQGVALDDQKMIGKDPNFLLVPFNLSDRTCLGFHHNCVNWLLVVQEAFFVSRSEEEEAVQLNHQMTP